jgi:hypothetical protein
MEKTIKRSFTFYNVKIIDVKTGETLKEEKTAQKISKEKVATNYIKETGTMGFTVEITEETQAREITLTKFLEHSTIVGEQVSENSEENKGDK